jgi:hypothetical protein
VSVDVDERGGDNARASDTTPPKAGQPAGVVATASAVR